ncbi:MAG: ABC transporter permease [Caldilineaceae bacterium]|nr:ABC transporter permease [Caldilineaceae bacterium]
MDRQQPQWLQFADLLYIELLNWRWGWRPLVLTGILLPVISIVLLGYIAGPGVEASRYAHILTGNVTVALIFTNMRRVSTRLSWMRDVGTLDYYGTLPVRHYFVVLSVLCAFFLLSLPSFLATLFFGAVFLDITLQIHPLVIGIVPLAALSLAGLGAYVGVVSRNSEEVQTYNQTLLFLFLVLGPVMIPSENLPNLMRIIGWFNPATYGASALRHVLLGPLTTRVWLDIALLLGLAAVSLFFVDRKIASMNR